MKGFQKNLVVTFILNESEWFVFFEKWVNWIKIFDLYSVLRYTAGYQNYKSTSRTVSEEITMYAMPPVSVCTARRCFHQRGQSEWRPFLRFPMTIQHSDRRQLWCIERQRWIHERYNVVLFRWVPILHAVLWWLYTCLEAPKRTLVICLYSISTWGPAPCIMV